MVVGNFNTISGDFASLSWGEFNLASGTISSVSGGYNRTVEGEFDWVADPVFADE